MSVYFVPNSAYGRCAGKGTFEEGEALSVITHPDNDNDDGNDTCRHVRRASLHGKLDTHVARYATPTRWRPDGKESSESVLFFPSFRRQQMLFQHCVNSDTE